MQLAGVHGMARRLARPLAGQISCRYRTAVGILFVSSALLLNPQAAFAQASSPNQASGGATTDITDSVLVHVVEVGDTLTNIAQQYNVKPADLAAYNQITDYNHIIIGQKLRIPPQGVTITEPAVEKLLGADGYHVVRQGESLGAIARLYGLTLEELLALNEIENPNLVRMGTMLRLTEKVAPVSHEIQPEVATIHYTVKAGDTLSEIAQMYNTTVEQLRYDNKLTSDSVSAGQQLTIYPPASALEAFGVEAPIDGERKIVIDLSEQSLTAYQGDVPVLYTIVSTGKASTPTRVGEFAIYQKLKSQHMTGEDYDLPGVPWVMYYDGEMAIHGAYWHANFGVPTSHGCTNMTIPESKALYAWAPLGTRVIVQQ
jgi:LysM repeat protein